MRIVSLVPSVTETLFELGLDDQIVAVTRWCTRPASKVANKPKVGGTKNPKIDAVVEFKPDVVILDCDENRIQDAEELERRGIRTVNVFPKTVSDSIQLLRDFGAMFSAQDKAQDMVDEIEQRMRSYQPSRRYSSLILIWRSPYMTVNSDTYVHSACRMFGFENAFANHAERYPAIAAAEIEQATHELVLFPDEPYPFRPHHMEQFAAEFSTLAAVKTGRLLLFDGSYIAWHGFGTLRALREFPSILAERLSS